MQIDIKRKSKLSIKYGRIFHESGVIPTIGKVKLDRQLFVVGGSYF